MFERQQGNYQEALSTISNAISKFPKFDKLYMIQGQLYQYHMKNIPAARTAYSNGIKACPKSAVLWVLASRLEEADGKSIKARSLLEKGRLACPGEDSLWAEAVRVEERVGGAGNAQAKSLLSRGLQECPASGRLWSMSIWMEARPARKTRSVDALKKGGEDGRIVASVARLFWSERKIEKAREWFRRAVSLPCSGSVSSTSGSRLRNVTSSVKGKGGVEEAAAEGEGTEGWERGDNGDTWGWWLKFERAYGTEEHREIVRKECEAAEPRHGEVWAEVAKEDANRGLGVRRILEKVADRLEA